jgi:hypothetical protein
MRALGLREKKKAQKEKRLSKEAAEQARHNYETASRKVSDWMHLWPLCPHPRCKRRRRCNGDFDSDGLFCLADASGETKLCVDKLCEVVAEGGSFEEAKLAAAQEVINIRGNVQMDERVQEVTQYAREVLQRVRERARSEEDDTCQTTARATGDFN